ncbi:MIPC synthase [Coprinopsis cinerea okayama7|uniref:MIPC synthase n=1 Tax=Coprinopsis cinerea (strain Okayama-7 / 130 / ATCC MYA-4618 / FGSC 9003) TaxID=240176 RepID=A8NXS6_COPC7|nr:MIPC synthase [Coprinopsis cinerea okayama7\|eukprot:XP_001837254.2 MIPC synthase [Coprinopsis cinerea okayama7\
MNTRRAIHVFLAVLALFLLGTVIVLSSVTFYLAIDPAAYLDELDLYQSPGPDNSNTNASAHRIPKIIHQTWKTDTLPPRWQPISQACRDMMPDYEYMLWTDDSSREFIAQNYPWFLETFDSYEYPIQRADAIRYFVLHHYGGVYMDLDIGCLRPMDPLLNYPVILPKTIPVGVSNDLMFAEKGHPFLLQTINNLVTFDHSWVLNYPTVMFSTGPMFLSAQYGIYTTAHPDSATKDIRILPKSLYGKNARPEEAPHSFFSHFYGSSWHADDAAFIGFLGTWGKVLMWVGLIVLVIGVVRLPNKAQRRGLRRISGYDIHFPRLSRSGRWYLPLGRFSSPPSPVSTSSSSESIRLSDSDEVDILHLPLSIRPPSPTTSDLEPYAGRNSPIVDAFRRMRNRVTSIATSDPHDQAPMTPIRPRRHRGILFFLPAIFTPSMSRSPQDIEMEPSTPPPAYSMPSHRHHRSDDKHPNIEDDEPHDSLLHPAVLEDSSSSRERDL